MLIKRLGLISIGAAMITLSLVAVMAFLIKVDEVPTITEVTETTIEFLRVPRKQEPPIAIDRRELTKVDPPPAVPKPEKDLPNTEKFGESGTFTLPPPTLTQGPSSMSTGFGPLVAIAPEYPARASRLGIEGYAIVEFTVTRYGAVADPQIIEASPAGYFEKSALSAIGKFKYSPFISNGSPVDLAGVQQKFTFELEN